MFLSYYKYAGGVKDFNEVTGTVSATVDLPREKTDWGYVWRQSGRWFAIRKDDQSLIFQAGPRSWRLRNDIDFRITRGLRRKMEIFRNGNMEFELRYAFRGAMDAVLDPSYDAMDEESDDFFLYVYEMWRTWKDKDITDFLK